MANTVLDRWISIIGPGKMETIIVQGDGASTGNVTFTNLQNPETVTIANGTAVGAGNPVSLSGKTISVTNTITLNSYVVLTVLGV